jgi:alanyl-tRNA synthetase
MYDKKIKVINDQYVEYNIHNKEYDALYSEVNKNSGDFNTLHEIYDKLVILTSTLFVQAAKQQNENAIEFIKNTDKQLNKAEKICYATVFEQNNKNIISALNDLTNTDKEHLYFIINKFPDKIQYIAVCNKSVKISCGELIKKIGALVDGSGGGGPCFAQGGVAGMEQIDKITSFINDYQFEKVNTTTTSELN